MSYSASASDTISVGSLRARGFAPLRIGSNPAPRPLYVYAPTVLQLEVAPWPSFERLQIRIAAMKFDAFHLWHESCD